MIDALRAEWTKVRTVAGTGWLVVAAVGLTVALSTMATSISTYSPHSDQDTIKLSLTGVYLGQAVLAILAVLAISGEYSSGMIRVTLVAMPRRIVVLAAKSAVISGLALVAGVLAISGSLLAGRLILPGNGFTQANGAALLSLSAGPALRAAVGSVLYLMLIALLSLGIAIAVRDSATAIGVVLGLLYGFPMIARLVSDPHWQRHLQQIGPMTAGLAIQNTTNLTGLPIGPWAGLGVLAAWAAVALFVGGLLLCRRDA